MHSGLRRSARATAIIGLISFALIAPTALADSAHQTEVPPVVVKAMEYKIALNDSGLEAATIHIRLQANNAAAANQIGQQPVRYVASMDDVSIVEAYTLKADGRKMAVEPASIYEQPVPGAPQMPMFDDQRQKVIVFPDVEAGDMVDFTYRRIQKSAPMPGHYTLGLPFSRLIAYDDVDVSLSAPKSYPLYVATHELQYEKHDDGASVVYHWHYSAPTPASEEAFAASALEHLPRLFASNFADYNALAHTYAGLIAPTLTVTPKISAKADEIVRGAGGHRAQAQKIYDWVSRHIRYVGVEIGAGAIIPHNADTVLQNGYGDCKDHAALFSALLKARGIDSQLVLINYGNEYELPDVGVLGAFNHVILWIPELRMFADTTSGVAPFGSLSFPEYGKPVVLAAASGQAVTHTPVLPSGFATATLKTTAKMDEQGRVVGQSTMSGTGPFAIMLRGIGLAIQTVGPERAVSSILQKTGTPGSGSYTVPPPDNLDSNYTITGDFTLGPFPDLLGGRRFAMPTGLTVLSSPGAFLMGPMNDRKLSDTEPTPCYSGSEVEDLSLEAPPGRQFLPLPPNTSIHTANLKFTATWSMQGQAVLLHREFKSTIDTALCSGEVRKETASALTQIAASYNYGVALGKELTPAEQRISDQLHDGMKSLEQKDYDRAVRDFSGALASQDMTPKLAPSAHMARGDAYILQGKYDQAVADFDEAVRLNPDLASKFPSFAHALEDQREFHRAEQVWSSAIGASPSSASLYDERGTVRDFLGDHDGAVSDFNRAISLASPKDKVAAYYNDRAITFWSTHDWRGAISDDTEALKHDDKSATAYRGRGIAEYFSGKFDTASADLAKAVQLDSGDLYSILWLYLAETKAGKDGRSDVARRTQSSDLSAWPGPLVRVMRGDLKPQDVALPSHDVAWKTKRDECEKDFYLAELALLNGDTATATILFRQSVDTNITEFVEYKAAGIELDRLKH
jgi:lipoprotein NlpI/transglutaminase-like putative cysteine protease